MKLVCDRPSPQQNVLYYTLVGLPGDPTVDKLSTGPYGFEYDLSQVPVGEYSVMVSACDYTQCSLPAPILIPIVPPPESPANVRTVNNGNQPS